MSSTSTGSGDDSGNGTDSDLVGVVVAAHDARSWVPETLRSIAGQSHPHLRCVVVDDGSTDGTAEEVAAAVGGDDRFVLVRQAQGGVSAARNRGLRELPAGCGTVAFVDSDDVWLPDAVEVLLDALRTAAPGTAGVTATAELVDERGAPVAPGTHPAKLRERVLARGGRLLRLPAEADTTFAALATAGRVWPPCVALLRRAAVDGVGGFDEALTVSEDWDLFLRVARGGPLRFLDRQVAWYRRHPASLTAARDGRVTFFNDVVRRKAWAAPENTALQRREALRGWRTVQLHAAGHAVRESATGVVTLRRSVALRAGREARHLVGGLLRGTPPVPSREDAPLRHRMLGVVQPSPHRRTAR